MLQYRDTGISHIRRLHAICIFCLATCCNPLPASPGIDRTDEHTSPPYGDIAVRKTLSTAAELGMLFDKQGYTLTSIRKSREAPALFVENLPPDLDRLAIAEKESLFIRLLLGTVAKVNRDTLARREQLHRLQEKLSANSKLTRQEQHWLDRIATDYNSSRYKMDDLLYRVDIMPVSLVLAQAIIESGWGTSHFAIAGNALYGQHLSAHGKGTFLTTPDRKVKVASFSNLYDSTAAYLHNLNTAAAYHGLRAARAEVRLHHGKLTGLQLVDALSAYSTEGIQYVEALRSLMKHHHLEELNEVQLENTEPSMLIRFTR